MSKAPRPKTKVVVRHLPPALGRDKFQELVDRDFAGHYNWLTYFPGKVSMKKVVLSRAYLNFLNPEDVLMFRAKFAGHLFVTNKGTQYRCAVEYAPFQKVPQPVTKKDALEGTLEKDPEYQAFVERMREGLELGAAKGDAQQRSQPVGASLMRSMAGSQDSNGVVVTPLMQFLRKKYEGNPFSHNRRKKRSDKAAARPVDNAHEGKALSSFRPEQPSTTPAPTTKNEHVKVKAGNGPVTGNEKVPSRPRLAKQGNDVDKKRQNALSGDSRPTTSTSSRSHKPAGEAVVSAQPGGGRSQGGPSQGARGPQQQGRGRSQEAAAQARSGGQQGGARGGRQVPHNQDRHGRSNARQEAVGSTEVEPPRVVDRQRKRNASKHAGTSAGPPDAVGTSGSSSARREPVTTPRVAAPTAVPPPAHRGHAGVDGDAALAGRHAATKAMAMEPAAAPPAAGQEQGRKVRKGFQVYVPRFRQANGQQSSESQKG